MRLATIFHLGIKELRGLSRDPIMLGLILYAFTMAVYTEGTSLPETLNKAPIAIVDEDQSPLSGRITSAFYRPYFLPPRLITTAEMDKRMDAGFDTFALDIPPEFQRDLLAGRSPTIQLNVDATRMSQAFVGNGYVQAIVSNEIGEFLAGHRLEERPVVDLALRARFNPELNQVWFGSVMSLIGHVTMLSIILTGAALISEREHGTTEHLLVMPVTPFEIMASKIWSMGLVVFIATGVSIFGVIRLLMDVPVEGSIGLFMLGTALQLFATTCMGVFLACIAGSMPQFGMLIILTLLPLEMLSGASTPRESMPAFVQNLMLLAPNTHYVMMAQAILYRGAGLSVVWPQLLALLLLGIALFSLSLAQFRRFLK